MYINTLIISNFLYICTMHFKNYLSKYLLWLLWINEWNCIVIVCYFYFSQDFLSTFEKFGCSVHSFTYLISRYLNYWSYKVIKSQIKLAVNLKKTMYQCICFTYKNRPVAKDLSWKIEFLIKCFQYFAENSGLK